MILLSYRKRSAFRKHIPFSTATQLNDMNRQNGSNLSKRSLENPKGKLGIEIVLYPSTKHLCQNEKSDCSDTWAFWKFSKKQNPQGKYWIGQLYMLRRYKEFNILLVKNQSPKCS